MRLHGLADLNAAHGGLIHIAYGIASDQLYAIGEAQGIDARVDVGNDIALVLIQPTGQVIQVVVTPQLTQHPLDTAVLLDLKFNPRHGRLVGGDFDVLQKQVRVGAGQILDRDPAHVDLFHQLLVIGIQRVEAVNLVVLGFVGGRVAHDHQRVEFTEGCQRLGPLHLLRLIEKQDRPIGLDHVDRSAGLEVIQLFVNPPLVSATCSERLDVDDHDVDARIRGKALQVVQLLGVVDEEARLLAVAFQKVLGSDLQRFVHTLTDGNARHHDDELAPAIAFVQLEHALDVAVGLAGAGFHLDIEVDRAAGFLVAHQRSRLRQVLPTLHRLNIFQQLSRAKRKLGILEAGFGWLSGALRAIQVDLLWRDGLYRISAGVDAIAHAR